MTESRKHVWVSQCAGKVAFDSAALAHEIAKKRSSRRRGKDRKREPRVVYRCRWCGKWHLGQELW